MDQKRLWTWRHSMQYPLKHYDCGLQQPNLRFAVIVWKPWSEKQRLKHFFGVPARLASVMMALREPLKDGVLGMQQSLGMKMSFDEL